MSAEDYTWVDSDGDELTVESGDPQSPALTIATEDIYGHETGATVYLPTDPAEVQSLVRAILDATGCVAWVQRTGAKHAVVVEKRT